MIAAALALGAVTVEQPVPWKATADESVEVFRAMERYARGDVAERIRATDDMDRVITRIVARAYEQLSRRDGTLFQTR